MAQSKLKNRFKDISVTLESGVTRLALSGFVAGKLVGFSLEARLTTTANSWKKLGTITPAPSIITGLSVKAPVCATGSGTYSGMIEITTSGVINLYSTQALNNQAIAFSIAYGT